MNGVFGGRALVTSSTPALSSAPNVRRTREYTCESVGTPGSALAPGRSVKPATVVGSERRARSGWRGSAAQAAHEHRPVAGDRRRRLRSARRGSTTRPVGSGSSSTPMISLPEIPSTTEWWILVSSATRPSDSPWIT